MHYKDLLGVGYCIPVPDFYLVLQKVMILSKRHSYGLIKHAYTRAHTHSSLPRVQVL